MPTIGEIKKAREIYHYKAQKAGWNKLIYHACIRCGEGRWVLLRKGKPAHLKCHTCAAGDNFRTYNALGKRNVKWQGGRWEDKDGYVHLWLRDENNFFSSMANTFGYVLEHRLVMAKHLGRCLQKWEIVHHKNGVKNDNRVDNLEIATSRTHMSDHNKGYKDGFQKGYLDGLRRAKLGGEK